MAFPANWPPRQSSGVRSGRFYVTATATADYSDRAYMFSATDANMTPFPATATPMTIPYNPQGGGVTGPNVDGTAGANQQFWMANFKITNTHMTDTLYFSFDGTNDHGQVRAGQTVIYRNRYESGIAVKGNGIVFAVEAW